VSNYADSTITKENKSRTMRKRFYSLGANQRRDKSPEEKIMDLLKDVPTKIVNKFLSKPRHLPQSAFTILYDEPKSANEVMGSKEGCRAIFQEYD